MAPRKAFTLEQWEVAFDEIVSAATEEFGKVPCIALEADEDGNGARLVASITVTKKVKKFLGGRGTITNSDTEDVYFRIYRKEIPTVLKLLHKYPQPDTDFDANLEYWSLWEEPQAACQNQAALTRWS